MTQRGARSRWRARLVRWTLAAVVPAAVLVGATGTASQGLPGASGGAGRPLGHGALLRRTEYGIPHIVAADHQGLGFGAGYAFAEDNLCPLADIVVTLSAQRSRWFGAEARTASGVDNLDSDLQQQEVNQSGTVQRLLARSAPLGPSREARDLVRGYVAGYNRYLAGTTVAGLPDPTCRGAQWVRPITELDLWRRAYQVAAIGDDGELLGMIVGAQPPGTQTGPALRAPSAVDSLARRDPDLGSNGWALGRQATTDRTGMVLANPHLPWTDDQRLYQMQLTIPGQLNVSGATFAGLPVIGIGHTDRLAWTHTASTAQPFTLTRLTLTPGDPLGYLVDGQVRRMQPDQVTVSVRGPDGTVAPVTRTLYRTPDGPLVEADGGLAWTGTSAYVLRDPNATNLRTIDQWLAMARARNVMELRAAQARLLGITIYNTLAADVTGTAYYGDLQVVPNVSDELRARCTAGPAIDVIILDGSRSSCGWGSDADAVEPGLLGPSRLPTLLRADDVSNSNDSPWLANPAAPLTGYPAVVGNTGTERSPRTRMGLDMIADRLDGSDGLGPAGFTLSTLQATMLGNRNLTAEEGRAAVVAMCRADPTPAASDGHPVDVRAACAALAGWNGRGDLDARGAVLWRTFIGHLRGPQANVWQVPFDPADPTRTPRGFDADQPAVHRALADTVQQLDTAGVPLDVRLGDAQHYAGVPIHGCSSEEGCFNVAALNAPPGPGGAFPDVARGSTFIMAVELTRTGPRARTILTYGQSANPASPHHTDQTRLYSAKQWVTDRFSEAEIAADPALTVHRLSW